MPEINSNNVSFDNLALYNKDQQLLDKLKTNPNQHFKDYLALKKASQDMETIFLNSTFGMIYDKVSIDPLLKDNSATRFIKSQFINAVNGKISESGKVGIAKIVEKQMLKNMNPEMRAQMLKFQEVNNDSRNKTTLKNPPK